MIPKNEIKSKDFSCAVPEIISKLTAISQSLQNLNLDDFVNPVALEALDGHGRFLDDVIADLNIINKELYWSDEKATEPTETG